MVLTKKALKFLKANERKTIRNALESRGITSPSQRLKQHHVDYFFDVLMKKN